VVAAVEVGNIFPLSTKFSKAFKFKIEGKEIIMGSYGIGVSRVMGILAEIFNDEKGLKWPINVAPFQVYLAPIGKDDAIYTQADALYEQLKAQGVEVFYDDRRDKKVGPGQKFGDAELLGIPYRVVLSEKLSDKVELVERSDGQAKEMTTDELIRDITSR